MSWKDGPFQVLEWINDNAYKLDLPNEYNASTTFNVSNLSPFDAGDILRTNPLQEVGNDGIKGKTITSTWDDAYLDLIQVFVGPVTRARSKKFKEALNGLIQATWAQSNLWRRVERIAHDKCMIQALEVSNKHFHEIGSWLAHYHGKIYYFPFLVTFLFFEVASLETNKLFMF